MKHDWEYKPLGEVLSPKKQISRASLRFGKEECIDYIDISSIDRDRKSIVNTTPYVFGDAPSRAQQCVEYNDILLSMVRPNLKNIAIVKDRRDTLVASSGFCVLRSEQLLQRYIFHLVTSDKFTNILISKCSGATYPAVTDTEVRDIVIPVPPMEVQERIVAELDTLNDTMTKCKELLATLDSLAQSLFYDTFGDPISNPKGWDFKQIGEICNIVGRIGFRGYTRNDLVSKGKGAITLSPSNIVNGILNYENCSYISWMKYDESPEIKIFNGDVILTKTGSTVGKVGCVYNLPEKATINPQLVVLKNLSINNRYLTFTLRDSSYQSIIREKSGGSAVPTISQKILSTIEIPIPPLELQEKFAGRIEQIDVQKKAIEETIAELQTLLDSRMDYWFN